MKSIKNIFIFCLNYNIIFKILPVIIFIIGCVFLTQIFPIYSGPSNYDQDPAYAYLSNALLLLSGNVPYHIDHPGTPLQILIAIIFFIEWLFFRFFLGYHNDIIDSVIQKPEIYMFPVCLILLLLNAYAVSYFGKCIYKYTKSIKLSLFCQAMPLTFWVIEPRITYLSPEALLLFSSLCLLGVLTPNILSNESSLDSGYKQARLAGIICGFAVAVKITFFPMIILLMLLDSRKKIVCSIKYMFISFFICILPIIKKLFNIGEWIINLTTHSGLYGSGKSNFIETKDIFLNIISLLKAYYFFYFIIFLLCVIIFLHLFSRIYLKNYKFKFPHFFIDYNNLKVPSILLFVSLFHSALVLKHFTLRYMLPVLPVAFIAAVWIVQNSKINFNKLPVYIRIWGIRFMILIGIFCIINSTITAYIDLRNNRIINNKSVELIQTELNKYKKPLIIGTYLCFLPECALSLAAEFAPALHKKFGLYLVDFQKFHIFDFQIKKYGESDANVNSLNKYLLEGRDVFLISPKRSQIDVFTNKEILIETPGQNLYKIIKIGP